MKFVWSILLLSLCACMQWGTTDYSPCHDTKTEGCLRIPFEEGQVQLVVQELITEKKLKIYSDTGFFRLPLGKYQVISYWMTMEDEDGSRWIASCDTWPRGKEKIFSIRPGRLAKLKVGIPFSAKVVSFPEGADKLGLDYRVVGSGNGDFYITSRETERDDVAFQLMNDSGTLLEEGVFRYG